MLVMSVVAGVALLNASYHGEMMQPTDTERWLLLGSGVATALPLWWFNEGAKRLPLKTVGILQYLAPCLQFLCAVLFFKESFGVTEAIGFGFIWLAIAVYILRLLGRVRS
jgi:chloramphenicol-sensitive protein RarD